MNIYIVEKYPSEIKSRVLYIIYTLESNLDLYFISSFVLDPTNYWLYYSNLTTVHGSRFTAQLSDRNS